MTSSNRTRLVESAATAGAGAALGALVGARLGLGRAAGLVGAANGAISGWRGTYRWASASGPLAFVLDSTWALGTTAGALGSHGIAAVRGQPGYVPELSRRHNRHVYRRGFQTRPKFLLTVGNVVSGAGDTGSERRRSLVTVHENAHVWQARALGPAYPVLYAAWLATGAVAGVAVWSTSRREVPLAKVIETCSYYLNPFEWWAYSRDGQWPPSGAVAGLGWRRPMVGAVTTIEERPTTPR